MAFVPGIVDGEDFRAVPETDDDIEDIAGTSISVGEFPKVEDTGNSLAEVEEVCTDMVTGFVVETDHAVIDIDEDFGVAREALGFVVSSFDVKDVCAFDVSVLANVVASIVVNGVE